jgi:hypothetical protein
MSYPWENEDWYKAHTAEWDALAAQGWQFVRPREVPANRVGLTIFRRDDRYTMYVAKDREPQEIHAELLDRCKYHAAYAVEA